MEGAEFQRRVRRLAKQRGLYFAWDPAHGKGSHGTLTFDEKSTTLKDLKKEIGPGLLGDLCRQIGIDKGDLNDV